MNCYVISYDLDKPGQNYYQLYEKLRSFSAWCHPVDSTWFVLSSQSAAEIRDELRQYIDNNDKLVVAKLSGEAAWFGLDTKVSDWLRNNTYSTSRF